MLLRGERAARVVSRTRCLRSRSDSCQQRAHLTPAAARRADGLLGLGRLLVHKLLVALVLCCLCLADNGGDLEDFTLVVLRAVDTTLDLLRAHLAALLRHAPALQMHSNFFRAFVQLLYPLAADEQFALGLDEFEVAAQLGGGLLEDAVAPRPVVVVEEIRDDQNEAGNGKNDQRLLLLHENFRAPACLCARPYSRHALVSSLDHRG